ncbi:MAG: glycosyltransferase family 4 protein [Anaerolineae bacterium]
MRVGIDARLVYHTRAGIGEYTLRLTQALAAAYPDVSFCLLQDARNRHPLLSAPNVRIAHTPVPSHHRFEQWFLPWAVSRLQVDVFHSTDFIPPLRYRGLSVITIHDLAFLIYPHFLTRDAAQYYGQIDQAVRVAQHIIAVSRSTRNDLVRMLGVPEDKISVIYEAADPLFQPLDRATALQSVQALYDLPESFILFVSTIEPRKNVTGLLRAYRRLRDDYKLTPALVLVGARGWLSDEVFELVEKLELQNYTFFLGRVDAPILRYLYNAALCLVHPAFYEGFGLTPLEAMACGTPVIVSNVSSLPEVVGDAGLLVNPQNDEEITIALWRLLTDETLRAELRTKSLQRAARFSWQQAAEQTMAVYRQVIGR